MDAADEATDPVVSTPGDRGRDGVTAEQGQLAQPGGSVGGDAKPRRKRGRPPGAKNKRKDKPKPADAAPSEDEAKELRALKKHLRGILKMPAAVVEPWPSAHIEAQAPDLADAILAAAKDNPALRRRLLLFFQGGTMAQLIGAGVAYALPVAIYYNAPAPPIFRKMLQVPDRRQQLLMEGGGPVAPPVPATEEQQAQLQAEAEAHGFTDPAEYMAACKSAVAQALDSVRGPHFAPTRPESPPEGA